MLRVWLGHRGTPAKFAPLSILHRRESRRSESQWIVPSIQGLCNSAITPSTSSSDHGIGQSRKRTGCSFHVQPFGEYISVAWRTYSVHAAWNWARESVDGAIMISLMRHSVEYKSCIVVAPHTPSPPQENSPSCLSAVRAKYLSVCGLMLMLRCYEFRSRSFR